MSDFEDAMAAIADKAGVEYEKKEESLPPPKEDPERRCFRNAHSQTPDRG